MTKEIPWAKAIEKVLTDANEPVHYKAITEAIAAKGYRKKLGKNPTYVVSSYLTTRMKDEGDACPWVRTSRGTYSLKAHLLSSPKEDETASSEAIIHAFGMYWLRSSVDWKRNPRMLGSQQIGADSVDMSQQLGVYLLNDGREVIYVGRSVDRPIGQRLYEHTQDRLRSRWDRFSWFGLLAVAEDGSLSKCLPTTNFDLWIQTLEAVLIEAVEPRQNRKRGDDFNAVEYIQVEDATVAKKKITRDLERLLG